MASLTHALLTEDEAVLLGALAPRPGDRVLALFAGGNGDAALSLLQAAPQVVWVHDVMDQASLLAQLELKRWLFRNLDHRSLRHFLGLEGGFDAVRRAAVVERALGQLPSPARSFWRRRRRCLLQGMARADGTSTWSRHLTSFIERYDRLARPLQRPLLRLLLMLTGLYFPAQERRHSLGYRQLRRDPRRVLERFRSRHHNSSRAGYVPYEAFRYLGPLGWGTVRGLFERVVPIERLATAPACNRIYFSNVIDYLSRAEFEALLQAVVPGRAAWRGLINSSYDADGVHPHLQAGVGGGRFHVDWRATHLWRSRDRVGVYPGLTVVAGAGSGSQRAGSAERVKRSEDGEAKAPGGTFASP